MEIEVVLKENQKLEAKFDNHIVLSDQPLSNQGEDSAPSPFDYFLASTAMCAGYYTKVYCKARNIPFENIKIIQHSKKDSTGKLYLSIEVALPQDLQDLEDKHREGIKRAVEGCTVKKAIQMVPEFEVLMK